MNESDRATSERHRAIWQEFRRRPLVSAGAGRPSRPPQVSATLGFVLPVDDAAVRRSLQAIVSRLEGTGCVSAFPPDYWHITIVPPTYLTSADTAPPHLLPASFVQQALEKGRKAVRTTGPFDVTVRGLNAFRNVVVAVPYDGGRGLELGRLLHSAMPELPERYPDGHELLPHVSLGLYTRDDRLEELVALIQSERETDLGRFCARRLAMYVLPEGREAPGAPVLHEVPLD